MARNGNGTTPTQHEQLQAVAEVASGAPIADFMTRVEHAAQLLADVGRELGNAGAQDERELLACAEQYRTDMARIVEKILTRHQRRVGDLKACSGRAEIARHGTARPGLARQGVARRGAAWRGTARLGLAGQGKARNFLTGGGWLKWRCC